MKNQASDDYSEFMAIEGSSPTERIVKVPFPVALIRRMDEVIVAGQAGFESRAEFMQEAVENLLNELEFPEASAEPFAVRDSVAPAHTKSPERVSPDLNERLPLAPRDRELERLLLEQVVVGLPAWERQELTLADLTGTALVPPKRKPWIVSHGAAEIPDGPLLGLHNRDYSSLWGLQRMARYTADGLVPFEKLRDDTARAAWYFGGQLSALEQQGTRGRLGKLTVLFPTNTAKQPSAERGFQAFAIGSVTQSKESRALVGSGPLFAWRAIQIEDEKGWPAGLTESGWELINELEGLSLHLPHSPRAMRIFMSYIAKHAPGDRWGFDFLLGAVAEGPSREEVVERFNGFRPEGSRAEASSIVQGYIARSREWGLVEPQIVDGRYWLTATGREFLDQVN